MASISDNGASTAPAPASTYSGNPGSSPRDQVRFILGDTGPSFLTTDGELDFLLQANAGNVYRAAMQACYSLVAQFSRRANETVGQISVQWSSLKDNFAALASSIQTQQNKFGGDFRAYLGGRSRSERESLDADPDRIGSQFRRSNVARRYRQDDLAIGQNPYVADYDRIP